MDQSANQTQSRTPSQSLQRPGKNNSSGDSSDSVQTRLKTSFMRSLCMGEIEEDVIFPFPKLAPNEKETLNSIFSTLHPWLNQYQNDFRKWDRAGELPSEFLNQMREMGMFSFIIPEEFGGLGLSNSGYSRMVQELSKFDGSVAITAGAHSSIGMRGLLLFGTPEQKAEYLPDLASGKRIAAFCLTEAGAGSDAASIKTKAVKEGDHWILTGEKIWITNGGIANFFTVFAKTEKEKEGK